MRIARLVTAAIVATTLAVFAGGAPALAHNPLTKAVPAKNATVTESPAKVELTFLESLDDSFSIAVTDGQKQTVPTGKVSVGGKKGTVAFDGALANGSYTVTYKLVADDGDPITGSYKFTVATPEPAPSATSSPAAAPAPSDNTVTANSVATTAAATTSDESSWPLIVSVIVAVAVIVGGGLLIARRRRSS